MCPLKPDEFIKKARRIVRACPFPFVMLLLLSLMVRFVSFHFVSVIINAIVTVEYVCFFCRSVLFSLATGRPIKSEINEK